MRYLCRNRKEQAFTLVDVLAVIIVILGFIAIAAEVAIPNLETRKAKKITCANYLMQQGMAFKIWAGDHGDKYPMDVSVTNGGVRGSLGGTETWKAFLVMSNELASPLVLHCPADTDTTAAASFSSNFDDRNISYFLSPDANDADPQQLLSGDDNFEINGTAVKPGILVISSNNPIAWSSARHKFSGNILLADGSVQSANNATLTNFLSQSGSFTNRLIIP